MGIPWKSMPMRSKLTTRVRKQAMAKESIMEKERKGTKGKPTFSKGGKGKSYPPAKGKGFGKPKAPTKREGFKVGLCHKCGRPGHWTRDCPYEGRSQMVQQFEADDYEYYDEQEWYDTV